MIFKAIFQVNLSQLPRGIQFSVILRSVLSGQAAENSIPFYWSKPVFVTRQIRYSFPTFCGEL